MRSSRRACCATTSARLDPNRIEVVLPDGASTRSTASVLLALPRRHRGRRDALPEARGAAARVERALRGASASARQGTPSWWRATASPASPFALAVLREGVLLHSLDGAPLPEKQGGPFRLLIPDDASPEPVSCANVKGVAKIVVRE